MANQYTSPPAYITCATCGKTKRVKAYKALTAKFCDRECQGGPAVKHGDARNGQRAPEYDIWCAMLARCQNPANPFYPDYGGRGIRVCAAWQAYQAFIADVGYRPQGRYQLERLDNNRNYEPGNVMWATVTQQQRNKRDNAWLIIDGVRRLRIEWAELQGIPHTTVRNRLSAGWTPEQALNMAPPPLRRSKRTMTVGSVTRLVTEWSKQTGIPSDVIRSRLRLGWSAERTLGQATASEVPRRGRPARRYP